MDNTDEPDDRTLVARARLDPDAFALLYRRYLHRIHAFTVRRCGDRHLADDITALVFERAWKNIHRVEVGPAGLGPWLYRIAANEVSTHFRRNGRKERALERLAGAPVSLAADPADTVNLRLDLESLRAALDRIPARHHEVIALRYLAGLSPQETAEAMGTTPQVVAALLYRALGSLERVIGPEADSHER